MAINKGTLAKEVNGIVEYIYPKTASDIVEYTPTQSVKEKLDSLDTSTSNLSTNITFILLLLAPSTSVINWSPINIHFL